MPKKPERHGPLKFLQNATIKNIVLGNHGKIEMAGDLCPSQWMPSEKSAEGKTLHSLSHRSLI